MYSFWIWFTFLLVAVSAQGRQRSCTVEMKPSIDLLQYQDQEIWDQNVKQLEKLNKELSDSKLFSAIQNASATSYKPLPYQTTKLTERLINVMEKNQKSRNQKHNPKDIDLSEINQYDQNTVKVIEALVNNKFTRQKMIADLSDDKSLVARMVHKEDIPELTKELVHIDIAGVSSRLLSRRGGVPDIDFDPLCYAKKFHKSISKKLGPWGAALLFIVYVPVGVILGILKYVAWIIIANVGIVGIYFQTLYSSLVNIFRKEPENRIQEIVESERNNSTELREAKRPRSYKDANYLSMN